MAKYSIELRTASHVSEALVVGSDDHTALRIDVAKFVVELLKDHAGQIWKDEDWRVDVTDERGLILYIMHISATQSESAKNQRPSAS